MITKYVLGFAFSEDKKTVALIRKNRPEWQAGLLNGIGGHIESSDVSSLNAMVREFKEETGVTTFASQWSRIGEIIGYNWHVDVFKMFCDNTENLSQQTDEEVAWYEVESVLGTDELIPNLNYLIPMALDDKLGEMTISYI